MAPGDTYPPLPARLAKLRHDLRTPLNHIIGYAEMLAEDAPEALRPDLARIRAAGHTLLGGIEEALDLVREIVEGDAAAVPALQPAPLAEVDPPVQGGGITGRLLIVDDDEGNRDLLARRLERHGFAVEVAADGQRALELIDQGGHELVLLDIMMPGMSGIEVLRRIRARFAPSELPVIMATAKDASADVVEALALGANDYVTKPINVPVVMARTRTHLELRQAHQEIGHLAQRVEARGRFIRETFGRYLTDDVVAELLERPEGLALGGETRTVTVLMGDLRGFSSLAERLAPQQVIGLLNQYLGVMTEIIQRHGGTIDEFIGDAILVIFGAPSQRSDDALRAVACAVEMQLAMATVNDRDAALDLPPVEIGIGINTGEAVVGNIGSERRAKYGVVGRTVNLASRIQAYAVGGQVLVSQATLAAAGSAVQVRGSVEAYPKGSPGAMCLHDVGGVGAPYAVALDAEVDQPTPLAAPGVARYAILDGVRASSPHLEARVTHLAPRAARLETTAPVGPMQALKLELCLDGQTVLGDIYARVVASGDDGRTLTLRFTSVPPAAVASLARLASARA